MSVKIKFRLVKICNPFLKLLILTTKDHKGKHKVLKDKAMSALIRDTSASSPLS